MYDNSKIKNIEIKIVNIFIINSPDSKLIGKSAMNMHRPSEKKSLSEKQNHYEEIENNLTEKIGLKIKIQFNPKSEKCSIKISCENLEQFEGDRFF